jgi:hypothetical protein
MTRDIRRRLQKLEPQVPRQTTGLEKEAERLHLSLFYAVAYYLGDPRPEGSVAEAYARALRYPNAYEFRNALDANDEDFNRRWCEANDKLLAKFGVSWGHERDAFIDAFKRMEAGLSERYKRCWHETATPLRA